MRGLHLCASHLRTSVGSLPETRSSSSLAQGKDSEYEACDKERELEIGSKNMRAPQHRILLKVAKNATAGYIIKVNYVKGSTYSNNGERTLTACACVCECVSVHWQRRAVVSNNTSNANAGASLAFFSRSPIHFF